ncbi:type II toxin-antitoxin system VapC family toxin [Cellulomonas dongxiuzhuiae]|uniref:type II toxin-antitoxin system VapC family toxin n=1 Tax=Cellulomonas dongxiuzhuiae TaxID=2819979 RepID=UPI001AAFEBA3|nr:type II toxin-antitoxin system VapC family toxin [Cellulomonas dongxiuzhuiae]MBO3089398.1 type II toxin-antitoxin system VapC family toxin [Cellulomonas dongxiuzhuiae]
MTAALVVDASAVLAVLIDPGPRGERAAAHMAGALLAAPDLLGYEVLNVLRRRRAAGHLTENQATLAVRTWSQLPVDLWPLAPLQPDVWRLTHNLSAYDAAHVALAAHLEAPLLTGDRRLAGAPGVTCQVVAI